MFCAAPMSTASIRGVVPIFAVMGAKKEGNKVREKNAAPDEKEVEGLEGLESENVRMESKNEDGRIKRDWKGRMRKKEERRRK
jgi:hypothetical protein